MELTAIHAALTAVFGAIDVPLPAAANVPTLARLRRYEDALDALVCAWVGTRYAEGPPSDSATPPWRSAVRREPSGDLRRRHRRRHHRPRARRRTPTSESYASVAAVAGTFEAITRFVAERFGERDASPDI